MEEGTCWEDRSVGGREGFEGSSEGWKVCQEIKKTNTNHPYFSRKGYLLSVPTGAMCLTEGSHQQHLWPIRTPETTKSLSLVNLGFSLNGCLIWGAGGNHSFSEIVGWETEGQKNQTVVTDRQALPGTQEQSWLRQRDGAYVRPAHLWWLKYLTVTRREQILLTKSHYNWNRKFT